MGKRTATEIAADIQTYHRTISTRTKKSTDLLEEVVSACWSEAERRGIDDDVADILGV